MKKTLFLFASFAVLLSLSSANLINASEGHESSSILWKATKVTGGHSGTVAFKSSDWRFDDAGSLVSANFVVDMTSVKCTDLGEGAAAKLEGHLASADFFDSTNYPEATFSTTTITSTGKGEYKVNGDMTIKDITKTISFETSITNDGHLKTAMATVVVDRTDFGIEYKSGSFFEGLGDKMIHDEFTLEISIAKH